METHFADFIHTGAIILALFGSLWKLRKDISKEIRSEATSSVDNLKSEMNQRFDAVDKMFDKIESDLRQINQNHIEHLMNLHAIPTMPTMPTMPPVRESRKSVDQESSD